MRGRGKLRVDVASGERVLAGAATSDGVLAGTVAALYLPDGRRVAWDQLRSAEWDNETDTLSLIEVGNWGQVRPQYAFVLNQPGRLLELIRERVSSTVVFQRHVALQGRRGIWLMLRRAPSGSRELSWQVEYDAGIDPDDPATAQATQEALAAARAELGV